MRHRGPWRNRRQLTAGWLAAFGVACLTYGVVWPSPASQAGTASAPVAASPAAVTESARPAAAPEPSATATTATPGPSATATATRAAATLRTTAPLAPVQIRIPSIGVAAPLDRLGLQKDRTVQVPDDPMHAGWYRLGPVPGRPGSAVILGHVDSSAGLAVFGRLQELRAGDRVHVEAPDGITATFEVTRLATYPNAKFPAAEVYAATGAEATLNLVTCGGEYDRRTGHLANLVVFTRLVHAA